MKINKPYKGIIDPYNIVTILFSDGYHDVVIGNLGERRIRTSPIVKRGEDYVETENNIQIISTQNKEVNNEPQTMHEE